jgi:signal recognition particle subunit SRP54
MFENLSKPFRRVLDSIGLKKRLTEANIEEAMREIRMALIDADVSLPVIKSFVTRVKEKVLKTEVLAGVEAGDFFIKILKDELVSFLGGEIREIQLREANQLSIILLCGLQGSGKTTTAGKLAKRLKEKRDILLVSLDVNRPAAAEQLKILAGKAGVDFYERGEEKDPLKILKAAKAHAERHVRNLIIVDTAGRTQLDEAQLKELAMVHKATDPCETLFISDSMVGQQALTVAKEFGKTLPITAAIFTKFDSDTRGGAVLSVKESLGIPVLYAGMGEGLDALEGFDPERIAGRMLGMGDVIGLVEKVQQNFDQAKAEKLAAKIKKNEFDLEDFLEQIDSISKMGGMESLMEMLPGMGGKMPNLSKETAELVKMKSAILSMTKDERARPFILNGNRRQRIAKGSGTSVLLINQMLKKFDEAKNMMKKMSNPLKMKKMMEQMGMNMDPSKMGDLEKMMQGQLKNK